MYLNEIDMKNTTLYIRDGKNAQAMAGQEVDGIQAAGQNEIDFVVGGVAAAGLAVGMWLAPDTTVRPRYFITKIATDTVTLHKNLEAAIPDTTLLYVSDWNELEIEIGEGNMTWSLKLPRDYKKSKGRLSHVKDGDEEPMDVSVDALWDYLQANTGGTPTIYEALLRKGEAATWISAGGECQPYSVDIVLLNVPDCATLATPNELIIFPDFRPENLDGDLGGGTLALPGKSFSLTPITARYA